MDKNLFFAIALSMTVYAVWFGLIEKRVAPASQVRSIASSTATPGSQPQPSATNVETAAGSDGSMEKIAALPAGPIESVRLGDSDVRIAARGAAVVGWLYREPLGTVELITNPDPGLFSSFEGLEFKRVGPSGIVYSARRKDGLEIIKEFIQPKTPSELPKIVMTLKNTAPRVIESGAWNLSLGPGLGTIPSEQSDNVKMTRTIGLLPGIGGLNGKLDVFKPGPHEAEYRWLAVDNRYFLSAVLPKPGEFAFSSALPAQIMLAAASVSLKPGQSKIWEIPYYVGAKDNALLHRYGKGLDRAINLGYFSQLGRLILRILNRMHSLTNNWGWAIILMTMLIQAALFPLTYKSLKAQAAMRRLQPEITRLQQRYAKDAQKLNVEMMELYKKNGANPIGGCLPMVLQMPVFISLYNSLRSSWELHAAPWMFWIKDLSARDPYYILPVVMGGLMYGQNKLNAQAGGDPTQQQMMTWMPVIFTFMFLKFPAGLVLYWLTNSLANALVQIALKNHFAKTTA